jgi:hypothetical protein
MSRKYFTNFHLESLLGEMPHSHDEAPLATLFSRHEASLPTLA